MNYTKAHMNLAQRAKRLQAHSLRCQVLTCRLIGERMNCTHSTAADLRHPDPLPPPNNRRELAPDDSLARKLFGSWIRR